MCLPAGCLDRIETEYTEANTRPRRVAMELDCAPSDERPRRREAHNLLSSTNAMGSDQRGRSNRLARMRAGRTSSFCIIIFRMARCRKVHFAHLLVLTLLTAATLFAHAQTDQPVRVVIVGLEHEHVDGFLHAFPRQHEAELVGIVDADPALRAKVEQKFNLDHSLFY